ncbi:MAG: 50S ribosome-binding GTPase, partial [Eubacteriales bacterium]|nr:50S ribosome-binding GTPase [Eubacteriales bacterium]
MNGAVDLFGQFFKIIDDEEKSMQTANLMVIGKTGAGKSTLINSVFRDNLADTGIGTPVTKHLQRITKSGIPLVIYDTKGIELNQAVQEEIKKEILGEIDRLIRLNEKENLVHMIWFCISSLSRRIEDFEVEWIRSFAERLPVIVVLTQAVGKEAAALEKYIKNLNLPVKNVRSVLAQDIEISDDYTLPAFGLKELVDITFDCLPEAAHTAFVNAQKVNIERKLETANKAIIPFVTAAFAEGFNPLPFADAALLVPTQLAMLARLTVIFGI